MRPLLEILEKWVERTATFMRYSDTAPPIGRPTTFRPSAFLSLGWRQYFVLVGLLASQLIIIQIVVEENPLQFWYWIAIVKPAQEARYGFHATVYEPGERCLDIDRVDQNGTFDLAGIKAGWAFAYPYDICPCYADVLFVWLRDARGSTLELPFYSRKCGEKGGQRKRVTILIPKDAA